MLVPPPREPRIERLVDKLLVEFEAHPMGRGVARVLGGYANPLKLWQPFIHFHDDTYTRNLVARNEWFELLVLCWTEGQRSPIHNHAGQNCWMCILQGDIEEEQFEPPPSKQDGPLTSSSRRTYRQGETGFIRDDLALHWIGPKNGPGISLHLYSRPIERCNVYDPSTGAVTPKILGYFSVHGHRT